jgi:hypothetical protein
MMDAKKLTKRMFRGNAPRKLSPDFGSIGWAIRAGKGSARTIRSIRAGGYSTARKYFEYYGDGRTAHGAARRALSSVKKLGNPKPYFLGDAGDGSQMIFALNAIASLSEGRAIYWPMRHVGSRQGGAK